MKFNFWKKDKTIKTNEQPKVENKVTDNSDVSRFYDYDKVAHNQFLTNDEVKSKYTSSENISNKDTLYSNKYNSQKTLSMKMDEIAFKSINDEIKSNVNYNSSQYENLRLKSNDLNHAHKIPVKKRGLFSKNENNNIKDNKVLDNSNDYNIVENFDRKYENEVDYYGLSKEQTKLLDLDELFNEDNNDKNFLNDQQVVENNQQINHTGFYVDKTKASNLTNRLFEEPEIKIEQNDKLAAPKMLIPRKTIRLSNDTSSSFVPLDQAKNNLFNNTQKIQNNEVETPTINKFVPANNQVQERIPTTALRYLTPAEEDDILDNSRVKKENRRFIKFKD